MAIEKAFETVYHQYKKLVFNVCLHYVLNQEDAQDVTQEDLGFTKDSTEFLHTEHVLLIDQAKHIRGIYNGTLTLETEQILKDIEELLNEQKKSNSKER